MPQPPSPPGSATRAIALLAVAAFATQAMVRVTDSLLPQIAADFQVSVGAASIVVTAYPLAHGSVQLVIGPIGDRFGKYRTVTLAAACATVMVALCGLAASLPLLVAARLGSGFATGWIIPFAMAFVGDVIPYERRQQVLGRFLSGQILGQLFGQAAGGVLGDYFGWRTVFFILAAMLGLASVGLLYELARNPVTRSAPAPAQHGRHFFTDYATVLRSPWARMVIVMAFVERRHVRRLHLCRRRPASALRFEFRAGRPVRRHLRDRRADLQPVGAPARQPARPDRPRGRRRRTAGGSVCHARLRAARL